jgi:hypothetical protein
MLFYTVGQSRIFLTMLYAGLAVGFYVSIDSAARRLFGAGRLMSLAMDLLLGIIIAVIACLALVIAADGELRLYSLLGILCGFLIYRGTLEPFLHRCAALALIPLRAAGRFLMRRTLIKKLLK